MRADLVGGHRRRQQRERQRVALAFEGVNSKYARRWSGGFGFAISGVFAAARSVSSGDRPSTAAGFKMGKIYVLTVFNFGGSLRD